MTKLEILIRMSFFITFLGRPVRDAYEEVSKLWNKPVTELADIEMLEEADVEEDERNNDLFAGGVEEENEDIEIN